MYIIYCNNFIYIYMCMYTYRDTHTRTGAGVPALRVCAHNGMLWAWTQ